MFLSDRQYFDIIGKELIFDLVYLCLEDYNASDQLENPFEKHQFLI